MKYVVSAYPSIIPYPWKYKSQQELLKMRANQRLKNAGKGLSIDLSQDVVPQDVVSPDVINAEPSQILPHLFLAAEKDVQSAEFMRDNDITHVLNVSAGCHQSQFVSDCNFFRISVDDTLTEQLSPHFETAIKFIEDCRKGGGRVVVHCFAGISRSSTIVIAYCMFYLKYSQLTAYAFVKQRRPIISPNINFMGQLMAFESQLSS